MGPPPYGSPAYGNPPGGPPNVPRAGPAHFENKNMQVSMDKVVDDFANMGFTREQVRGVIRELQESGKGVDLNLVLDRLMNTRT